MSFRTLVYLSVSALLFTVTVNRSVSPASLGWALLQGLVITAAFYPVVRWTEIKPLKLFGALWLVLIIVGVVTIASEGAIFTHVSLRDMLLGNLNNALGYTVLAVAMAYLPSRLGLCAGPGETPKLRSARMTAFAVLPASVFYLVVYFIFGGIFYAAFTKPYYTHQVAGGELLNVDLPVTVAAWLPFIQIARGALMTVAMIPIVRMLRLRRWSTAVVVGSIIWVVGGLAPLLPPNPIMPGILRLYHTLEIFTQNFALGVAVTLLMRGKHVIEPLRLHTAA
jgi:uncharacterized membrane protein (DUF485 family)